MDSFKNLHSLISRLPGIGKKSAYRISYFLLNEDPSYVKLLSKSIGEIQEKIKKCAVCFKFTENEICEICQKREKAAKSICVVQQSQDVDNIEKTGLFSGTYHILGALINPLDGIGAKELNLHILKDRVIKNNIEEIIIATNPTIEGDTTALYISNIFKDTDVKISRLALGLPVGGDLEYADEITLSKSLEGRILIKR